MSELIDGAFGKLPAGFFTFKQHNPMTNQPAPSDAPTPRTDAASVQASTGFGVDDYCDYYVPAEFARQLERELTRLSAEREKEREELSQAVLTASDAADLYKTVLGNLMPFILEDYHPNCATTAFRSAVEAAKELFPK